MCYPISGHHTSQTLTSANQPAKNAALIRRPLAYSNKNDDDNGEGDGAGIDEVGKKIQGRELTLMPNLGPPRIQTFDLRPSARPKILTLFATLHACDNKNNDDKRKGDSTGVYEVVNKS